MKRTLKDLNLLKVLGPKFEGKEATLKSLPDVGVDNSDLDIYTTINIDFEKGFYMSDKNNNRLTPKIYKKQQNTF